MKPWQEVDNLILSLDFNTIPAGIRPYYEPVPAGSYLAQIIWSSIIRLPATGQIALELTWMVLNDYMSENRRQMYRYQGRRVIDLLLLEGSAEMLEYSKQRLAMVARIIGSPNPARTRARSAAVLYHKPCGIDVVVKRWQGKKRNLIHCWSNYWPDTIPSLFGKIVEKDA